MTRWLQVTAWFHVYRYLKYWLQCGFALWNTHCSIVFFYSVFLSEAMWDRAFSLCVVFSFTLSLPPIISPDLSTKSLQVPAHRDQIFIWFSPARWLGPCSCRIQVHSISISVYMPLKRPGMRWTPDWSFMNAIWRSSGRLCIHSTYRA